MTENNNYPTIIYPTNWHHRQQKASETLQKIEECISPYKEILGCIKSTDIGNDVIKLLPTMITDDILELSYFNIVYTVKSVSDKVVIVYGEIGENVYIKGNPSVFVNRGIAREGYGYTDNWICVDYVSNLEELSIKLHKIVTEYRPQFSSTSVSPCV